MPYVGYTEGAPDINYALSSTNIVIAYDAQTGVSSISQPSTPIYFSIAVVPQAIMVKHPNTNWSNANEVAQLPEVKAVLK